MKQNLNIGGKTDSVTPSTRLLNQKLGTLSAPRILQPSEIALLRQRKREIARKFAGNLFAGRCGKLSDAGKQVKSVGDFELITWLVIK